MLLGAGAFSFSLNQESSLTADTDRPQIICKWSTLKPRDFPLNLYFWTFVCKSGVTLHHPRFSDCTLFQSAETGIGPNRATEPQDHVARSSQVVCLHSSPLVFKHLSFCTPDGYIHDSQSSRQSRAHAHANYPIGITMGFFISAKNKYAQQVLGSEKKENNHNSLSLGHVTMRSLT